MSNEEDDRVYSQLESVIHTLAVLAALMMLCGVACFWIHSAYRREFYCEDCVKAEQRRDTERSVGFTNW